MANTLQNWTVTPQGADYVVVASYLDSAGQQKYERRTVINAGAPKTNLNAAKAFLQTFIDNIEAQTL